MGVLNLEYSTSPKFKIAAKLLDKSTLPVSQIARISGVSERTVYRWATGAGGPMYLKERDAKLALNDLNNLGKDDKELIADSLLPDDALDDAVMIVDCPVDDLESAQTQEIEPPEVKQLPAQAADLTEELHDLQPDAVKAVAQCFEAMERLYQSKKVVSMAAVRRALPDVSGYHAHAGAIAFYAVYGVRPLSDRVKNILVYICNHFEQFHKLPNFTDCMNVSTVCESVVTRIRMAFRFLKLRDPNWKYDMQKLSSTHDEFKPNLMAAPKAPALPKSKSSCSDGRMLTLKAGSLEICMAQESLSDVIRVLKEECII